MNHITNNSGRFVSVTITALCVSVIISSCGASEKKQQEQKEQAAAAATPAVTNAFILQKGKLSAAIQIPGELIAFQQVDLYAKVNGFVKKLYADVGTEVKTGQLLAVMEAPELGSQLAGAQSRLQAQEAIYTASKANYDRLYETSKTPGTISPNDIDQAKARKNADSAQWQSAKSAYREIAETQNYLEIRAPFSGVISTRNVNTGAIAGPAGKGSELPLFVLQDQRKLRLAVLIPESVTSYVNDKTTISFTVKGLPNEKFTAMVKRSAGSLDLKLRSERIEMDIINNDKKLLPGMVAQVSIPTSDKDSGYIVPKTAIINGTERIFVIKISNGNAQWVDVKNGRESDGKVEVYGPLNIGDTIVTTASEERRNGSAVMQLSIGNK
ncbi:MAG TPA: efflux RND transporter periplasmic adaptor subunit [Chitinophagaceae bacterium]|jgi:membrane fusion protein, multidrug efflux system|nr:efflux RND transporter periplasmic adaptor subunit [Chitinophagaceae bacterium]